MIGGGQEQQSLRIILQDFQGRDGRGRCGVATGRFQDDAGIVDAGGAQLLGDQEAVLLARNHDGRGEALAPQFAAEQRANPGAGDAEQGIFARLDRQHEAVATPGRHDLGPAVGDPVHHLVEHGHQDRRLAAEVPVDAGTDDAGLRADVSHRDRVEAAPGAESGRGGENPLLAAGIADPHPGRLS